MSGRFAARIFHRSKAKRGNSPGYSRPAFFIGGRLALKNSASQIRASQLVQRLFKHFLN